MEQGDELRFQLYEHERDSPSVHLLCREDLLWQSRGINNYHADKLPASQGQRGRVYLEDLDKLCMFLTLLAPYTVCIKYLSSV